MRVPPVPPPDVERDGHHGVEDDDVGPEGEEAREGSVDTIQPGEEGREHRALLVLPDTVPHRQDRAHERQEAKDLVRGDSHMG